MIFNWSNPRKKQFFVLILLFILFLSAIIALLLGSYQISLGKACSILYWKLGGIKSPDISKMDEIVFWNIRFPRLIMSILVGIALSSAGTAYQGCFRNPLVEPYILGASAGAALGAAMAILFPSFFFSITISAFAFSLVAVFLSYFLAKTSSGVPVVGLILSGVVISSIFMACVAILKYLSEDAQLREITFWMMGGLYYSTWKEIPLNSFLIISIFLGLWSLGWKLNLLSISDQVAKSLGVNPETYKIIFILMATLISATSVASAGIIAWIGLMMPHAARLLVGPDNRLVFPVAAILGATYLLICDTLARNMILGEIPVGIITSLLGAPFLIYLLRSKSKDLQK